MLQLHIPISMCLYYICLYIDELIKCTSKLSTLRLITKNTLFR